MTTAAQERDEEQPQPTEPVTPRRRRWPWLLLLALVGLSAVVVLSVGLGRDPAVVDSVLLDEPAPELAGPTLGGGTFDLDDHRGKVVLVNVWASWCPPCRREYPLLERAGAQLPASDFQLVGIDTQDTEEDARAFLDEMGGSNYPNVLDPDSRWGVEWGIFGVPETFVVDRDGRLRAKYVGELQPGWIEETVAQLLAEP